MHPNPKRNMTCLPPAHLSIERLVQLKWLQLMEKLVLGVNHSYHTLLVLGSTTHITHYETFSIIFGHFYRHFFWPSLAKNGKKLASLVVSDQVGHLWPQFTTFWCFRLFLPSCGHFFLYLFLILATFSSPS